MNQHQSLRSGRERFKNLKLTNFSKTYYPVTKIKEK